MASEPAPSGDSGGGILLFFGIMLLIFLAWVVSGGPSRPLSFSGPYLGSGIGSSGLPSAPGTAPASIRSGQAAAAKSAVSFLRDTGGVGSSDEESEYVVVMASALAEGPVSLSGMKLVSAKTGKTASIPQGTEIPRSGSVNPLEAITLAPGTSAIIVSGRSPIGSSFRENRCTGYLEERQDFHPSLSQSCPTPYQEFTRFYDDEEDEEECAVYVSTISYCESDTRVPSNVSSSCRNFVGERLNYNGCVAGHRNDPDFKNGSWRIYLGASDELWKRSGETIQLIDQGGNVLDTLSY